MPTKEEKLEALRKSIYFAAVRLLEYPSNFCGLWVLGHLHIEARVDVEGGTYRPLNKGEMKVWAENWSTLSYSAFANVSTRARFTRASESEPFWRVETPGLSGAGFIVLPSTFPGNLKAPVYVANGEVVYLADSATDSVFRLAEFIDRTKDAHPFRIFEAIRPGQPVAFWETHEPYEREVTIGVNRICPELFGNRRVDESRSRDGIDKDGRKNLFTSQTTGEQPFSYCQRIRHLELMRDAHAEALIQKVTESNSNGFVTSTGIQLRVVPPAERSPADSLEVDSTETP